MSRGRKWQNGLKVTRESDRKEQSSFRLISTQQNRTEVTHKEIFEFLEPTDRINDINIWRFTVQKTRKKT